MYKFTTEAEARTEISRLAGKVVMAATINNDTATLDAAYEAVSDVAKTLDRHMGPSAVERAMQRAIECVQKVKGSACQS